MLNIKKSLKA